MTRPHLPRAPNTCAVCGLSDWTVSMTEKDGATVHVACSTLAPAPDAQRPGRDNMNPTPGPGAGTSCF